MKVAGATAGQQCSFFQDHVGRAKGAQPAWFLLRYLTRPIASVTIVWLSIEA